MRKMILLLSGLVFAASLFAGQLIVIENKDDASLKSHFASQELVIHYYSDQLLIATAPDHFKGSYQVVSMEGMNPEREYYIAWFHKEKDMSYVNSVQSEFTVLLESDQYLLIEAGFDKAVYPPIDGRVTRISNKNVLLPKSSFTYQKGLLTADPDIIAMMDEVDTNIYVNNVQHLQDYGTRNAYTPQSVEAQNWLKTQFESYGYSVELFDFTMPQGPASDNVIATKVGTKYPDEYVVIGGHYDSYSYSGNAPGADDDASGVCGVMEVARVMADFETDRTVLFCAWSGEEYGLYGSEAYADWAASEGMNILGYFNMDMIGYRHPGDAIHTDMIAPSSAQPLVDFYTDVCGMYLPDFIVDAGTLTGGDSDHTSFNNAGYMGIFPFEDTQNYSPYIHTSNDVIGMSLNSLEMAMVFTQAMVANVATMANWLTPPANLIAMPGDALVQLAWDPMDDASSYNVYKDSGDDPIANVTDPDYMDAEVENFTTYSYYVTAIYTGSGDESDPSNMVTVTPLPAMAFPFMDDYESGGLYWNFEGNWGLSTSQSYSPSHSMTESPSGNYTNNTESTATLYNFSLENAVSAELTFQTKYDLETGYDYTWLEISTNGINWTELEEFNGVQNAWTEMNYSLEDYLGESNVIIRFRFYSDGWVTEDGMYIDDFELNVENSGVGIAETEKDQQSMQVWPNPFTHSTTIIVTDITDEKAQLNIFNATGEQVATIERGTFNDHSLTFEFDATGLPAGIYFCTINLEGDIKVSKLILKK